MPQSYCGSAVISGLAFEPGVSQLTQISDASSHQHMEEMEHVNRGIYRVHIIEGEVCSLTIGSAVLLVGQENV